MPTAFVIMPFSNNFDDIYSAFIYETLKEAGYEVFRADDINNSQNILADIVHSIATSDLIVSDLTSANPNVFYELGIAHALNKPVIMLTQEISELPFDLRAYRVISYSTDFIKIREAKQQLLSLSQEAAQGRAIFGNPVSDFSNATHNIITPHDEISAPAGFLDHMADLESSLDELTKALIAIGSETEIIGTKTQAAGARFETFEGSANERRLAVRGYALDLSNYSNKLKSLNSQYTLALYKHEKSINDVLSSKSFIEGEDGKLGLLALLDGLQIAENGACGFLAVAKGLITTMESTPDIERTLMYSRNATIKELNALAQNLEKTISVFSRTRALATGMISEFDAKTETESSVG